MVALPTSMRVLNKFADEILVKSDHGEDLHRVADAQALVKELGV